MINLTGIMAKAELV